MKSVKFYDNYSIITILIVLVLGVYELIYILSPKVNNFISPEVNYTIMIFLAVSYGLYHWTILRLSHKLSYLEHSFLFHGFTLAPVSYFGKLRKLLKKYYTENNNNLYNN